MSILKFLLRFFLFSLKKLTQQVINEEVPPFIVRGVNFVKYVFSRITAAILTTSALALSACSPRSDEPSQVKGSVRVLLPLNNSQGTYSLDIFELKGIEDLQTLAGRFVRFFLSPSIVDEKLHGSAPKARFLRNTDGAYVPSDEISQQLATVYAHMQRLAALDEELGVGDVNKWPRDIGVGVRIKGGLNNNAFYDGKTDSMLFVPYVDPGLAIAINGGILAHEHFHSLFYKRAMRDSIAQIHSRSEFVDKTSMLEEESSTANSDKKILPTIRGQEMSPEDMRLYYHMAMLRGLNEGLADYWGWMYTGDPDFIAQSLPSEKTVRSLKVSDEKSVKSLPTEESIQKALKVFYSGGKKLRFTDYVTGYAYTIGTQFSRVMKRYADIYASAHNIEPLKARKEVAKIIVKILPDIKEDFKKLEEKYYTSTLFLNSFLKHVENMQSEDCQYLAEVFNNSTADKTTQYICKEESGWKVVSEQVKPVEPPKVDEEKPENTGSAGDTVSPSPNVSSRSEQ